LFLGAPANPEHPLGQRYAYGVIAVLLGITAGLGNALVSVNLLQLQGALGSYVDEIAWLPAAYVMTNISMNLLLIRFRKQFGLRPWREHPGWTSSYRMSRSWLTLLKG
jgi:hypothetical protein